MTPNVQFSTDEELRAKQVAAAVAARKAELAAAERAKLAVLLFEDDAERRGPVRDRSAFRHQQGVEADPRGRSQGQGGKG